MNIFILLGCQSSHKDTRRKADTDQGEAARQRQHRVYFNYSSHSVAQGRYQTLYVTSFIHNYRQELARYPALTTEKTIKGTNKSMAARSGSTNAPEKKSSKHENELPAFSPENLQNNMRVIYYSRTFLSIMAGVVAGILGLTGWKGFIFYFMIMILTSLGVVVKIKFDIHEYFDSWNRVILDGISGGLMSFVLFWTFAYDIVHIF
ncbi:uncharacterized protein LOC131038119 isoform X3 [Cryptomeria japonica]|uniref:uncharacterized protein LOC131038119 isoform X3 n=1 Tax=Cryptomeria japonica TaxID=3369 RepID=UPI0027DA2FBD|nr:uncharacterized protein LOC131038119 isoform X3 [Cryptomeria japonica]